MFPYYLNDFWYSTVSGAHSESGEIDYDEFMEFLGEERSPYSGEQFHRLRSHWHCHDDDDDDDDFQFIGVIMRYSESVF